MPLPYSKKLICRSFVTKKATIMPVEGVRIGVGMTYCDMQGNGATGPAFVSSLTTYKWSGARRCV